MNAPVTTPALSGYLRADGRNGFSLPVLQLGLPDRFIEHGDHGKLLSGLGLDAAGIERSVQAWLAPAEVAQGEAS